MFAEQKPINLSPASIYSVNNFTLPAARESYSAGMDSPCHDGQDADTSRSQPPRGLVASILPDITPEAAFDRITTLASLTFNTPIALVSLIREDRLLFKSCFGLEMSDAALEGSFCSYVAQSDSVLVVPDARADPRFQDNPMVTGYPRICFYAGAPLKTPEGECLGTLCVIDSEPRGDFNQGQTQMLFELAGMATELLEARRVIRTLAEERAFTLTVLENISDAVVACNADGQLTIFNEAARALHGLPEKLLDPSTWASHYDLYEADGVTALPLERIPLYRAYRGEAVKDAEMVVSPRGGQPRHLRTNGRAFTDGSGQTLGAVVAMRDVTSERRAEAALRESEHHHRLVVETLQEGVVQQERDGRITMCNAAAERILGLSRSQMLGRESTDPRWRAVREDGSDYPGNEHPAMIALKTGVAQRDCIFGVFKPDRTLSWIRVNSQPLFYPGNDVPHAVVSSFADITDLKETERRLRHSALHDELTGLPTRVLLLDRLENAALRASRLPLEHYGLLFIDLDNFKAVNDTFGHHVGDAVLVEVAHIMSSNVRESDTVSRLGGDEFVVLLEGLSDPSDATRLAERLLRNLNTTLPVGKAALSISASIGVALPDKDSSGAALLERADAAMYRAKAQGKRQFVSANSLAFH